MAGKDGIWLLDDGALSQVWGGMAFHPLSFIPNGGQGGSGGFDPNGAFPGITPFNASPLDTLPPPFFDHSFGSFLTPFLEAPPGTTVYTPNGQASQGGGTPQTDGGQNP